MKQPTLLLITLCAILVAVAGMPTAGDIPRDMPAFACSCARWPCEPGIHSCNTTTPVCRSQTDGPEYEHLCCKYLCEPKPPCHKNPCSSTPCGRGTVCKTDKNCRGVCVDRPLKG
ncbi:PREDICTED: uncharacterized protein LOC106807249 isoform X3 [Priapulus caudatus]|uniref:Uncharacterized protein LOC106807249 isoform X3 n=1 Tax=Priapulus caudatus TaxID=37621 RepID=A0ABM1DYK6_PRICU|nr:PREDICTED: uncharacterized protein LOC106807249 isoform X3 [Priapulus caudatus]